MSERVYIAINYMCERQQKRINEERKEEKSSVIRPRIKF